MTIKKEGLLKKKIREILKWKEGDNFPKEIEDMACERFFKVLGEAKSSFPKSHDFISCSPYCEERLQEMENLHEKIQKWYDAQTWYKRALQDYSNHSKKTSQWNQILEYAKTHLSIVEKEIENQTSGPIDRADSPR